MVPQNPPKGKAPAAQGRTPTGSAVGGPSNQPQSLAQQGINSDEEMSDDEQFKTRAVLLEQTLSSRNQELGQAQAQV